MDSAFIDRSFVLRGDGRRVSIVVRDVADAGADGHAYTFELDGRERFRLELRHPNLARAVADELVASVIDGWLDLAAPHWRDAEPIILLRASMRLGAV